MRRRSLRETHRRLINTALGVLASCLLAACVNSEQPLLSTGEKLFGDQFQLSAFAPHIGHDTFDPVKTSVLRWNAGRYVFVEGQGSNTTSIVAQSVGKDEILLQISSGNSYDYYLARKIVGAAYQVVSVDDAGDDEATFKRLCVKISQPLCTVKTRAQLDAFVQAASGKPAHGPWGLAVLADVPNP